MKEWEASGGVAQQRTQAWAHTSFLGDRVLWGRVFMREHSAGSHALGFHEFCPPSGDSFSDTKERNKGGGALLSTTITESLEENRRRLFSSSLEREREERLTGVYRFLDRVFLFFFFFN